MCKIDKNSTPAYSYTDLIFARFEVCFIESVLFIFNIGHPKLTE